MGRFKPDRRPDLNTVVFVSLVGVVGIAFLCGAGIAYAQDGWNGWVSLRGQGHQDFTTAESLGFGLGALAISVFAAITSRQKKRPPKAA